MKILVIGGTGTVGSTVVSELLKRKADLRLFVRPKTDRIPDGVETATGDLLDPVSIEAALRGCDSDIAEVAAIALTTRVHAGKTYSVNGSESLSGSSAAAAWSAALGKPVRYGGHDMDAFEKTMRDAGAPAWSAFDMRMMFSGYLERGFIAQPGDLETFTALTGHAPRPYAFVAETVAAWEQKP